MDPTILEQNQLFAGAAIAFVVGALCMFFASLLSKRTSKEEDPRNHMIRQLEADVRSLQRQVGESEKDSF